MRELTVEETREVAGGALGLLTGAAGAIIGGGFAGAGYAFDASSQGNFSWGGFAATVATNSAGGFLIGSGTTLIAAAAAGTLRGAAVLGVTMIGVGGAITVSSGVSEPGEKKAGS